MVTFSSGRKSPGGPPAPHKLPWGLGAERPNQGTQGPPAPHKLSPGAEPPKSKTTGSPRGLIPFAAKQNKKAGGPHGRKGGELILCVELQVTSAKNRQPPSCCGGSKSWNTGAMTPPASLSGKTAPPTRKSTSSRPKAGSRHFWKRPTAAAPSRDFAASATPAGPPTANPAN